MASGYHTTSTVLDSVKCYEKRKHGEGGYMARRLYLSLILNNMKKQLFKHLGHDDPEKGKNKYKGHEAECMIKETNEYESLKQGPCDQKLNTKGKGGRMRLKKGKSPLHICNIGFCSKSKRLTLRKHE